MTKIRIFRDSGGTVTGFSAAGHASKDGKQGSDIYCAAVSAITQTACIGLEEVAKAKLNLNIHSGYLSVQISPEDAAQAACRTILETMLLGLTSFDEANPGHIQIIEEVQ